MPDRIFLVLHLENYLTVEQSMLSKPEFSSFFLKKNKNIFIVLPLSPVRIFLYNSDLWCKGIRSATRKPYCTALLSNYKPIHQQPNSLEREGRVCMCTQTHVHTQTTGNLLIKLRSTKMKDLELLIFIADTDTNILWGLELSI